LADGLAYTENCVQGGSPPCTCRCPLNFDIKGFLAKLKAGNFKSAYKDYRNKVVFPAIVSNICEAPCREVCPAFEEILLLERAAMDYAEDLSPERFNLPKRDSRVAVIGAGLSGLACALRLATKRYSVTVYERAGEPCGSLAGLLPDGFVDEEIGRQFANLEYTLLTGTEIVSRDALDALLKEGYEAVYIATGKDGEDFGLLSGWDPLSLATTREGVFLGGRLARGGHIEAIAQGLTAAVSIETWIKIHSMAGVEASRYISECKIKPPENAGGSASAPPANGYSYTKEEAVLEAGRCLNCDCTVCYDTCEFMKETGLMPRMIEINASSERGPIQRNSNRLIASCTLCGHCEAVCEFDASVEKAMRAAKKTLFETGGFAPAWHDFYMRDMEDAMGESFLSKTAPGHEKAGYVFFPGCQAPKDSPEYVLAPYRYMLSHHADTALMLACCGTPAMYAGDYGAMNKVHEEIRSHIRELGDPVVVVLCAACARIFREFLPELECVSLYEYICENGLPAGAVSPAEGWALFDPCASRKFPGMQSAVRDLLGAMGTEFCELPENRKRALCCGQGGHVYAANPGLSKKITATAFRQSDLPYMTYCTNCRNLFLSNGKRSQTVLDALFGLDAPQAPAHLSERDQNRRAAKRLVLREFWGCEPPEADDAGNISVHFPNNVLKKMDALLISAAEVKNVIASAEEAGDYFEIAEKGLRTAGKRIGIITIWVEYMEADAGVFEAANVYSHRIDFLPFEP